MAALFRVRIKQLEVKAMCMLCVFFRARIQLCLHFFHMAWIFAIGIQALRLRGYVKKPQTNKQSTKTKETPPQNSPRGVCFDFCFLFNVSALFVFAPLGIQQLECSRLACWHRSTGGCLEAAGDNSPPGKAPGLFPWAAGLWSIPCCPECPLHGEGTAAAAQIRADAACQPLSHQQLLPFSAGRLYGHSQLGANQHRASRSCRGPGMGLGGKSHAPLAELLFLSCFS